MAAEVVDSSLASSFRQGSFSASARTSDSSGYDFHLPMPCPPFETLFPPRLSESTNRPIDIPSPHIQLATLPDAFSDKRQISDGFFIVGLV